ncbi:MAG TPA: hypothetical protein VK190_10190 [Pseudoneobacillus sp.]|nr:hypothetical protein [Pseudoneobacillus sp.]
MEMKNQAVVTERNVRAEARKVWTQVSSDVTNYRNIEDVVNLLVTLQPFSEHMVIRKELPWERLLHLLESHGYVAGAYTDEQFDGNSKEIYGKWLIGQAMKSLQEEFGGMIPTYFHAHAQQFKSTFHIH